MVGALMNIGREGLAFGKCYLPTENADKSNPFIVLQVWGYTNLPIPTMHLQNQREAPSYPSDMPAHGAVDTLAGFKHHAPELWGEPVLPLCQQEIWAAHWFPSASEQALCIAVSCHNLLENHLLSETEQSAPVISLQPCNMALPWQATCHTFCTEFARSQLVMITLSELFLNYLQPVSPGLAVTVILLTEQVTMAKFFYASLFFLSYRHGFTTLT